MVKKPQRSERAEVYERSDAPMSAEILLRLSENIEAALPQLMLLALGRKVVHEIVHVALRLATCSSLWNSRTVLSLRDCYATVELRFAYLWATCYMSLVAYVVYDTASNLDEFINCKAHEVPRPLGIYCATSLVCFVFTTKLSTSAMSCVVMLCAKQFNILTGIAAAVNLAIWANIRGTSALLVAASSLAGAHFVFCRLSSSASLCSVGFIWSALWSWIAVIRACWHNVIHTSVVKKAR